MPHPKDFNHFNFYYEAEELNEFADLIGRHVIDWGSSARSWIQNGTTIKNVSEIKMHYKTKFMTKYPFGLNLNWNMISK